MEGESQSPQSGTLTTSSTPHSTLRFAPSRRVAIAHDLFQDHVLKGLKVSLESTFAPDTGAKNGLLKAEMRTNPATLTIDTVCTYLSTTKINIDIQKLSDNNFRI